MNFLKGWGKLGLLLGALLGALILTYSKTSFASHGNFAPNNLISDIEFIDPDGLSLSGIQSFLEQKGSFLKNYSENGRSAARIIWDASHGYGDATATVNGIVINNQTGTVNPQVILVTLQKEQSLISKTSQDDEALRKAMGFGCPDGGSCSSSYAGFTKQVESGAWQLRYNYERAQGRGFSDYQVGQSQCFSDFNGTNCATFSNRATASLYRYTPHVYNGNHNFHDYYANTYNFQLPEYSGDVVYWSSSDGAYVYPTIVSGQPGANMVVKVKNTGRTSWVKGVVNLATTRARDRVPNFARESGTGSPSGWISPNRITMQEDSVDPGKTGTFSFWLQALGDKSQGTYREYFELVADGVRWLPERGIYFDIMVIAPSRGYEAKLISWGSADGGGVYPTLTRGQAGKTMTITVYNSGRSTWSKDIVHLATIEPRDRIPGFVRECGNSTPSGWVSANRITMNESSVPPGKTATFTFCMQALTDKSPGTYRENFGLVADGITWFSDYLGIFYDVKVQ